MPVFLVSIALWLVFVIACVFVVAAGLADIFETTDSWGALWEKVALLIIFVHVILTGRRVRRLDEKIDQVRMCAFATINYFNIGFRNRRIDLPPGLGARFKDDLLTGFFGDNLLDGTYAARDGRKVTLADDIKSGMFGSVR